MRFAYTTLGLLIGFFAGALLNLHQKTELDRTIEEISVSINETDKLIACSAGKLATLSYMTGITKEPQPCEDIIKNGLK